MILVEKLPLSAFKSDTLVENEPLSDFKPETRVENELEVFEILAEIELVTFVILVAKELELVVIRDENEPLSDFKPETRVENELETLVILVEIELVTLPNLVENEPLSAFNPDTLVEKELETLVILVEIELVAFVILVAKELELVVIRDENELETLTKSELVIPVIVTALAVMLPSTSKLPLALILPAIIKLSLNEIVSPDVPADSKFEAYTVPLALILPLAVILVNFSPRLASVKSIILLPLTVKLPVIAGLCNLIASLYLI